MTTLKRRRPSAFAVSLQAQRPFSTPVRKRTYRARVPVIPGRTRVGGFYGRYSGPQGELKFHDLTVDDAVIATGGVITDTINAIPQGVTEIQRIGRKCTIRSIMWRGKLTLPELELEGNPGTPERVRLIMYLDKQCNGAAATALGILEAVSVDDYRNLANSGRFNILMDKTIVLNYSTLSHFAVNSFSMSGVTRNFSFFKKCQIPIEFDSTTGAITEIRSNNIGLLLVTEDGAAALVSRVRLRFSDT